MLPRAICTALPAPEKAGAFAADGNDQILTIALMQNNRVLTHMILVKGKETP